MNQGPLTSLGGGQREFPSTRWSLIAEAGQADPALSRRALDELCRLYWKPVYAYIRAVRDLGNEPAKDLAQEFFLELMEGGLLSRYAPGRGSFRRYLKGALQLFLRERHRMEQAQKRGGGRVVVSLDDDQLKLVDVLAERGGRTPEEAFDRQWAHTLLEQAVESLRIELEGQGRPVWFAVFDRYEVNRPPGGEPTYADLAREFRVKETDVANHLNHCRRRLREVLHARIQDYVQVAGEVPVEMAELFPRA